MEHPELSALKFKSLAPEDIPEIYNFFFVRPNKCCDSVPLDYIFWQKKQDIRYSLVNNECLFITRKEGNEISAALPLCEESLLPGYFSLLKEYFNKILLRPLNAHWCEAEGVRFLESSNMISGFSITKDDGVFDYLYDAESLRTLKGKKLAKKRNHINSFEKKYDGRYVYKHLSSDNKNEISRFLNAWSEEKTGLTGTGISCGTEYKPDELLKIESDGIIRLFETPSALKLFKTGGIYIDGVLSAFSIGGYNPLEKMAVIAVEKAFTGFDGIYQKINRDFLVNEFPDAETVNREDDAGLPGLRKSKLSYYPTGFAERYTLRQTDFI